MHDTLPADDSLRLDACVASVAVDTHRDRIIGASAEAARLFDAPDLVGMSFSRFVSKGLSDLLVFAEEVVHRGSAWSRSVTFRDARDRPLRCELRGRPLREDPPVLLFSLIDLAEFDRHTRIAESDALLRGGLFEWQRAEEFFRDLERQNQLILNAAGEGIYGVNAEGKTTFVNRAAQEMLGWTGEDLLGHDIHSMIHHHHLSGEPYPSQDCPIYRSFRFEQVNRIEDEVFWRKDGRPIRVEYVSTPIYDHKVLAGAVVIFRDITERKENERRLKEAVDEIAELRDRLEQENAYLQEAIISERAHHDIVGTSPHIRQLLAKIELVSRTSASVLISGEPGTGKALVATAIHKDSDRRRRPLIQVKCSAIPPESIESELFGQIRGAFPGALRDKPGRLELAHGGTLHLDDVDALPLDQQGQLMTALESRTVTRIGDTRARSVDIRVIASSSRALDREVAAGRFREDLYFFLNVLPVTCLPLRERTEDIPPLAVHLLRLACKRLNRTPPVITEQTMRKLSLYHWPGNVRELANVIERGAIVSTEGKLVVDIRRRGGDRAVASGAILTETEIEELTRTNLIACLREARGRVSGPGGAAELLGVKPTTLHSRIRKFAIGPEDWS